MYQRLVSLGVDIVSRHIVESFEPGRARLAPIWGGNDKHVEVDGLVLVTGRESDCGIYDSLLEDPAALEEAGIAQLHLIGDAHTPGMVAQATFSGHRLAREIDSDNPDEPLPFIRERRLLGSTEADFRLDAQSLRR